MHRFHQFITALFSTALLLNTCTASADSVFYDDDGDTLPDLTDTHDLSLETNDDGSASEEYDADYVAPIGIDNDGLLPLLDPTPLIPVPFVFVPPSLPTYAIALPTITPEPFILVPTFPIELTTAPPGTDGFIIVVDNTIHVTQQSSQYTDDRGPVITGNGFIATGTVVNSFSTSPEQLFTGVEATSSFIPPVSTVPLPAGSGLFAIGLLTLMARARRRF